MQQQFKIGEISQMYDISVRALHLYDKMDLFKPALIDSESGYRYYTADQLVRLNTIISFKKIGFSLQEIKYLFENNLDSQVLLKALMEKLDHYKKQKAIVNYNIESITKMIGAVKESNKRKAKTELSQEEKAFWMSRLVCLENEKLENFFADILWL